MSTRIDRSALVNYSPEMMFDLVNDVAAYPAYLDGCVAATVISSSAEEMVVRLDLSSAGVRQSFTTRNRLLRPHTIEMSIEEGPFRHFRGAWGFKALDGRACKVSLSLEFELKNRLLGKAVGALFAQVANNQVSAVVLRAEVVYGKQPWTTP
ncbi:MAG: type II toxin-antitoxin system RatA family toxin [Porticoccaceae bacterium]